MAVIFNGTKGTQLTSWTTATRPSSPALGQQGWNSTLKVYEVWTGGAVSGWVAIATQTP